MKTLEKIRFILHIIGAVFSLLHLFLEPSLFWIMLLLLNIGFAIDAYLYINIHEGKGFKIKPVPKNRDRRRTR